MKPENAGLKCKPLKMNSMVGFGSALFWIIEMTQKLAAVFNSRTSGSPDSVILKAVFYVFNI